MRRVLPDPERGCGVGQERVAEARHVAAQELGGFFREAGGPQLTPGRLAHIGHVDR
jgi:hypothetical protein